ncbi:hypothetical protein SBOR_6316 [Sclerotinia borealis F-4128]|uniref:Uncharacterized protein n=1 Tax=Sclerotinia borealis (strain F-4128) TaxID=1432307 RepID=W9CBS9_SCLBF|nr:hypothetical protein SBOR_6316 [Sclerotinia borealis F-4128]
MVEERFVRAYSHWVTGINFTKRKRTWTSDTEEDEENYSIALLNLLLGLGSTRFQRQQYTDFRKLWNHGESERRCASDNLGAEYLCRLFGSPHRRLRSQKTADPKAQIITLLIFLR